MKFSLAFLALISAASASVNKPQLSVNLSAGDEVSGNLGGVEPSLKWQTSGNAGGFDLEGGIDLKVNDLSADVSSFPTSVWGKASRNIAGADVSARGRVADVRSLDVVDLDVDISSNGATVRLEGSYSNNQVQLSKAQASKSFDALGGSLELTPKYDFETETSNLVAGLSLDDTTYQVDARDKKLTVSHSLDSANRISPSINAEGDFSVAYSRDLEGGTVTTTWTPDDSVKVEWDDGDWKATVSAPVDGLYNLNGGLKVGMKRNLNLS